MSWLKKLFEKDDWRFVGKVEAPYKLSHAITKTVQSHESMTYYLYENQHGERKFDVIDSDSDRGDLDLKQLPKNDWVFRCEEYRKTVHPWLSGFRNPNFPTYDKVPTHDFKRLLEGKDD